MKIRVLQSFKTGFKRLPKNIQSKVEEVMQLLESNPHYPSLRIKKMKGHRDIWEARVTRNYRVTFLWENDVITLRRVGTHDVLAEEN